MESHSINEEVNSLQLATPVFENIDSDISIPYAPAYTIQSDGNYFDCDDLEQIFMLNGLDTHGSNADLFRHRPVSCGVFDAVYTKFNDTGKPTEITYQNGITLPIPLKNPSFTTNVENAITLLSLRSKLPKKDHESQSQFLKICYTFVSGFLFSDIWRVSNYDLPKTVESSAFFDIKTIKSLIGKRTSLFLCLDTRILNETEYQGFIFSEKKIIDKNSKTPRPIPNKIFNELLLEHYDKLAIEMGYRRCDIRGRYSRKNNHILLLEIRFLKKLH